MVTSRPCSEEQQVAKDGLIFLQVSLLQLQEFCSLPGQQGVEMFVFVLCVCVCVCVCVCFVLLLVLFTLAILNYC
jgi:hypothetical protein